MKVFYPIFRGLIVGPLIVLAVMQQYFWWSAGCVDSDNWFPCIVWFAIQTWGSVVLSYVCFPRQNPATRHKFRCVFYSIEYGRYTRVCTRTYKSVWLYCFKQVRRGFAIFFIIRQLDN